MSKTDNVKGYEDKKKINWYPGHMAKTRREIKEKIDLIDIVYEVVDARMPVSSKIMDIDELVKNKPRILVMTKYDLCDKIETDKFVKQYKSEGYTVISVDLTTGQNVNQILNETNKVMSELNEKRKAKGLKPRSIRALIIGAPNVGKSTLINRLVKKKVVNVGNTPGVTKNLGWIRIEKDIELLDSPGILWPKLENQEQAHILASLSSIKEEILDIQEIAMFILELMAKLYPERLKERYEIENFQKENWQETVEKIALKRGALMKGGVADYDKVYTLIVRDLKDGNLGKITLDRVS